MGRTGCRDRRSRRLRYLLWRLCGGRRAGHHRQPGRRGGARSCGRPGSCGCIGGLCCAPSLRGRTLPGTCMACTNTPILSTVQAWRALTAPAAAAAGLEGLAAPPACGAGAVSCPKSARSFTKVFTLRMLSGKANSLRKLIAWSTTSGHGEGAPARHLPARLQAVFMG